MPRPVWKKHALTLADGQQRIVYSLASNKGVEIPAHSVAGTEPPSACVQVKRASAAGVLGRNKLRTVRQRKHLRKLFEQYLKDEETQLATMVAKLPAKRAALDKAVAVLAEKEKLEAEAAKALEAAKAETQRATDMVERREFMVHGLERLRDEQCRVARQHVNLQLAFLEHLEPRKGASKARSGSR